MRIVKFGGSSLGSADRLRGAIEVVVAASQEGPVVVVVSALGGVTDLLTQALTRAVGGDPCPELIPELRQRHLAGGGLEARERRNLAAVLEPHLSELQRLLQGLVHLGDCPASVRHRILALGERLSAPLVATHIAKSGRPSQPVDGTALIAIRQLGAEPTVDLTKTRKQVIESLAGLFAGEIPVVTGFIGANVRGETVTLGRGASDYTATILAAALDAAEVQIWSDVDGVYTADPRRAQGAQHLPRLSYDQAAALARCGAKLLHPKTLAPVARLGIPVVLKSTLDPAAVGTRIDRDGDLCQGRSVAAIDAVCLSIWTAGGERLGSRAFAALERLDIEPFFVRRRDELLHLVVRASEAGMAINELEQELHNERFRVERCENLGVVSVVHGSELARSVLLASVCQRLAAEGIEVRDVAMLDERTVASLIPRQQTEQAVACLHSDLIDSAAKGPFIAGATAFPTPKIAALG